MAFIVDDFSPAEVAGLLGKTPEAVRRNLCDARRRLRAALKQERTIDPPDPRPGTPRTGGRDEH
jgi:hypothetical protein